jgi:outer membrane protein OmpA-like peptidoglycan-associated protein
VAGCVLGLLLLLRAAVDPPRPPAIPPSATRDFDADGFVDPHDRCPRVPGPGPFGCPDPDDDDDRFPASADRCPDAPGVDPDGCPVPDADADTIADANDLCPGEPESDNGFHDEDGCPDQIPADLERALRPISGVHFHVIGMREFLLKPSARPALDRIVQALARYPDIHIELSAHYDSTEEIKYSIFPSGRRAAWIKRYLIEHGADATRIYARGAGPDEPIDTNKTAAGRARNRRIEFMLIPGRYR